VRAANGQFVQGTHWRQPAPHWNADWLREQYETQGRSTGEIAAEVGTTDAAIIYWLRKHGICRRSIAEARALKHWGASGAANPMHGKTGAANPRYVDGSSPERQRMYVRGEGRAFLRDVLERDAYRCRRCDAPKTGPRSLHVHHLKPWAGNQALRFDRNNAVTLCRPCHSWVHSRANAEREFLA
jgi:hypothetical protein